MLKELQADLADGPVDIRLPTERAKVRPIPSSMRKKMNKTL